MSLLVVFFTSPVSAAPSPRADLSLPAVKVAPAPDLTLAVTGESRAAALAHYSMALQLEEQGKMREALGHYREVLRADPANAELAARAADIAMNFSTREEAFQILRDCIRAVPGSPKPLLNLAGFLTTYASDDPFENDAAAKALEEALSKFPRHAEVYRAAVMHHLTKNARDAAIRVTNQALKQDVADPAFWLTLGRVAQEVWPLGQQELRQEHRDRVNPFFENALRRAANGDAETVKLDVARYYLLTNQLAQATGVSEKLAAEHNSVQARKMLYRLYEAAGKSDQAFATLQQIVKDNPRDIEQLKLLAEQCEKREDYESAARHLEAAIQLGAGEAEDYSALTQLLLQSRQFEKSVQFSQRCIRLFPEQIQFRVFAGMAHRYLEQWDKAIAQFAEADTLAQASAPEQLNYRFYFQYAVTLERAARFDDATKQFEKSITLTPKESVEEAANAMNYLGYMWLEQNQQLDKATELIKKANELVPNNAAYIDSLGWLHFKKGDYQAALTELQRAETLLPKLEPEDAEIIDHIGQTYGKLGNKEKALEYLKKARELDPKNEKIKARLDEALGKTKPAPPKPKVDDTPPGKKPGA